MQQGVMSEECQQAVLAVLAGLLVAIAASYWSKKAALHFALTAIRKNEISAKSSGVDIFRWLLLALS